jgi:hypothetical protein
LRYLVSQIGGATIGFLVGLGLAWIIGLFQTSPQPIQVQLEDVLAQAARQHLRVVYNAAIDLKGNGSEARVLVFRGPYDRNGIVEGSDRLQVYESNGNHLVSVLTVRPLFRYGKSLLYNFNWRATGQFDETAETEVIFSLDPEYADTQLPHPVALVWDINAHAYVIRPLLPRLVSIPRAAPRTFAAGLQRAYRPINVPLEGGGTLTDVGGTQAFAMTRSRLAAAYIVQLQCNACKGGVYEIKTFGLDFQNPGSPSYECALRMLNGRRPSNDDRPLSLSRAPRLDSAAEAVARTSNATCLPTSP